MIILTTHEDAKIRRMLPETIDSFEIVSNTVTILVNGIEMELTSENKTVVETIEYNIEEIETRLMEL